MHMTLSKLLRHLGMVLDSLRNIPTVGRASASEQEGVTKHANCVEVSLCDLSTIGYCMKKSLVLFVKYLFISRYLYCVIQ